LAGGMITAAPIHTLEPHEDYFEWIDLLESIMAAKDRYIMMELGAGYGRWSVRAAAALGQLRGLPCHLVAVEGEPRHYRWLEQHMSDNHIPSDARTLIRGVVSDHREDVHFYVGTPSESDEPASWYGQAIIQPYEAVAEGPRGDYEGQEVFSLKSGWKSVKARSYLLTDILPEADRIDLIDLDVQGEELKVISSAIEALDRKVARLHIGTHSHEIAWNDRLVRNILLFAILQTVHHRRNARRELRQRTRGCPLRACFEQLAQHHERQDEAHRFVVHAAREGRDERRERAERDERAHVR